MYNVILSDTICYISDINYNKNVFTIKYVILNLHKHYTV